MRRLAAGLSNLSEFTPHGGDYMYFFLRSGRAAELRQRLVDHGVFPVVHWQDSGEANDLLSIHVDQRYDAADMNRVISILSLGSVRGADGSA